MANQPRILAGTLDIAASQKAARFVRLCDAFNLPIVSLVDTPGFLPGKDLEWRGMIRHGAELAAQAEATERYLELVVETLVGAGYRWYETSNFARRDPGRDLRCRHNLGVWRGHDYLGLGVGAVSTVDGRR